MRSERRPELIKQRKKWNMRRAKMNVLSNQQLVNSKAHHRVALAISHLYLKERIQHHGLVLVDTALTTRPSNKILDCQTINP